MGGLLVRDARRPDPEDHRLGDQRRGQRRRRHQGQLPGRQGRREGVRGAVPRRRRGVRGVRAALRRRAPRGEPAPQGRGGDAAALKALAIYGITPADLAKKSDAELRAQIIKHQGVATKNIGTRRQRGRRRPRVGAYFSDSGGAMVQHYRADIAERTARAKDLMLYGEGGHGQAPQHDEGPREGVLPHRRAGRRRAQGAARDPQDQDRATQPRPRPRRPSSSSRRCCSRSPTTSAQGGRRSARSRDVKKFGPGASISAPVPSAAPAP